MLNTRGVSSFNDYSTNNTRILVRRTCILLYFDHGPPVFSILAEHGVYEEDEQQQAREVEHGHRGLDQHAEHHAPAEQRAIGSVLGSWGKTMRDAVKNKER